MEMKILLAGSLHAKFKPTQTSNNEATKHPFLSLKIRAKPWRELLLLFISFTVILLQQSLNFHVSVLVLSTTFNFDAFTVNWFLLNLIYAFRKMIFCMNSKIQSQKFTRKWQIASCHWNLPCEMARVREKWSRKQWNWKFSWHKFLRLNKIESNAVTYFPSIFVGLQQWNMILLNLSFLHSSTSWQKNSWNS